MTDIGLVLQGGGMRGCYTSGAIDCLLDNSLDIPYVVGVSAGACNALSYATHSRGMGKDLCLNYLSNRKYISYHNLLLKGSVINFDGIFKEVPKWINKNGKYSDPKHNMSRNMVVAATDCQSGDAVYVSTKDELDIYTAVRASASMPFISKKVALKGLELLDGGIADPIPIRKSIDDGNKKNIVILTNHHSYVQPPFKYSYIASRIYPKHKKLVELILNNHTLYKDSIDYIDGLEEEGNAIIITPSKDMALRVLETNKGKLEAYYDLGYRDTYSKLNDIKKWLQ